jgi:WD40 repeat protein
MLNFIIFYALCVINFAIMGSQEIKIVEAVSSAHNARTILNAVLSVSALHRTIAQYVMPWEPINIITKDSSSASGIEITYIVNTLRISQNQFERRQSDSTELDCFSLEEYWKSDGSECIETLRVPLDKHLMFLRKQRLLSIPDKFIAYCLMLCEGEILIKDMQGNVVKRFESGNQHTFSPDGNYFIIAQEHGKSQVFAVNNNFQIIENLDLPMNARWVELSPDNKQYIFTDTDAGIVYFYTLDFKFLYKIDHGKTVDATFLYKILDMTISDDGQFLAINSSNAAGTNIITIYMKSPLAEINK